MMRTIKGICMANNDMKHRRHAVRLSYALQSLRIYGRFDPTMTSKQVEQSTYLAETFTSAQLWAMLEAWLRNERWKG